MPSAALLGAGGGGGGGGLREMLTDSGPKVIIGKGISQAVFGTWAERR